MSSVSVVIPCYCYGHFLEAAVSSVLDDQDGVDVRVLIVDDASPDGSAEVAKDIASRRSQVDVLVHDSNQGNIATFNDGLLEWADGDYCTLLSADDRATPGALARARDLLDAHPEVGMVYGNALWVEDGRPLPTPRTKVRGWSVWSGQEWLEDRYKQAESRLTTPEVVLRTSLLHEIGGYDPLFPKAADMELFMRFAAYAAVGFIRGVDQAYYRRHPTSMSKSVTTLMDLRQRRSVFEVVLDRYGERLAEVGRLSDMVHRQLAREALWAAGRAYNRGRLRESEIGRRIMGGGTDEVEGDVEELLAFAVDCWPNIHRARLYGTLLKRRTLGPIELGYLVNNKGQWWLRRRMWKYRGS
jgi:glycosyltransferase involved in cell wall biosynthesis